MHFEFTPRVIALREELLKFMDEFVYPNEKRHEEELAANARAGRPYAELPMMAGLKAKARERGLWNFWLTASDRGYGLSTVEYAYLAEEMGWSRLAPETFNCMAPDTGNMEVDRKSVV